MCAPYPTRTPNANPTRNDARGWKSAVKKSVSHFHTLPIVGAILLPVTSVVWNWFSNLDAAFVQSTRTNDCDARYYEYPFSFRLFLIEIVQENTHLKQYKYTPQKPRSRLCAFLNKDTCTKSSYRSESELIG